MAVLAAAGVTAVPALGATAPATPGRAGNEPGGAHRALPGAGTAWLDLLDPTRIDPTSPTHAHRELSVRVWYPAASTRGFPPTPYLPPLAAAHFLAGAGLPPGTELPQDHRACQRAGGPPGWPLPGRALCSRHG